MDRRAGTPNGVEQFILRTYRATDQMVKNWPLWPYQQTQVGPSLLKNWYTGNVDRREYFHPMQLQEGGVYSGRNIVTLALGKVVHPPNPRSTLAVGILPPQWTTQHYEEPADFLRKVNTFAQPYDMAYFEMWDSPSALKVKSNIPQFDAIYQTVSASTIMSPQGMNEFLRHIGVAMLMIAPDFTTSDPKTALPNLSQFGHLPPIIMRQIGKQPEHHGLIDL